ncbi:MAG TPA: hypothetical protein P5079_12120, partial [Elusimicrobiota bacterium]|nr:hypothetical protein [Elusimicrobiota bacterium]
MLITGQTSKILSFKISQFIKHFMRTYEEALKDWKGNALNGTWTPSTLATAPNTTNSNWSNQIDWLHMVTDPNTNNVMLSAVSSSRDLRSIRWQPATNDWTTGTFDHTTNNASDYNRQSFAFEYDRHDTYPPSLVSNLPAGTDAAWRSSNTATYNVDVYDTGGSHLDKFQARASTSTGGAGPFHPDWTDVLASLSPADAHTTDWSFPTSFFDDLPEGVNYVSLRAQDVLGNYSTALTDAFFVRKDTTPPAAPSLLTPADNAYSSTNSVTFDWSDVSDTVSGIKDYSMDVSTDPAFGSFAFSHTGALSNAATTLASGKYYWRVTARDNAMNSSVAASTFAVTVDTAAPAVAVGGGLIGGDTAWRRENPGALYDVNFNDSGHSLLKEARYSVWTSTGRSGTQLISFANGLIADNIAADAYSTDWGLDFSFLENGMNYVSVQVKDFAGNATT